MPTTKPYTLQDAIALGVSVIPGIGGPLSMAWSQWDSNRRFQRVEETLQELSRLLNQRASPVEVTTLGDEGMQILESALREAQLAHTVAKRQRFAAFIANSWTEAREHPMEEKLLFLQALSQFQEPHIQVLQILDAAGPDAGIPYGSLRDSVLPSEMTETDKNSHMVSVLESLAAQFGFIRRAWGLNDPVKTRIVITSTNLSSEGIARKCNHAITPLGQRFFRSISPTH